jgi:hypothetical protein
LIDAHTLFNGLSAIVSTESVDGGALKISGSKDLHFFIPGSNFIITEIHRLFQLVEESKLEYGLDTCWG